jgi:hypothetical protein
MSDLFKILSAPSVSTSHGFLLFFIHVFCHAMPGAPGLCHWIATFSFPAFRQPPKVCLRMSSKAPVYHGPPLLQHDASKSVRK